MGSAGDSGFLFYTGWLGISSCGWYLKKKLEGSDWGECVPGRRIRKHKCFAATACLIFFKQQQTCRCGSSDIFKRVCWDEVQEDRGSDHLGLVSHCKDSGFSSEQDKSHRKVLSRGVARSFTTDVWWK